MVERILTTQEQFFALIRLAVGRQSASSFDGVQICWQPVYDMAKKHALLGICFAGIEKLPEASRPEIGLMLKWIAAAEHIRQDNVRADNRILELVARLRSNGFESILLKGRGVARLYETPLASNSGFEALGDLRSSGDIDVWIPKHSRREILNYLRSTSNSKYVVYHNAEYPIFNDVSVEVHFTPSWFWNFRSNCQFQSFCEKSACACLSHTMEFDGVPVSVPTLEFNRVFVLQHIYRHLFGEGIGLRQLLDYYFVLSENAEGKDASYSVIKRLGMGKFCAAVMWIMKSVFGIDDEFLLCCPNEMAGQFLLSEVMKAGNFGQYDERDAHKKKSNSPLRRFMHHINRDLRYVHSYPREVLYVPIWKIWHYLWRKQFTVK